MELDGGLLGAHARQGIREPPHVPVESPGVTPVQSSEPAVALADIESAAARIAPYAVRTPLLRLPVDGEVS